MHRLADDEAKACWKEPYSCNFHDICSILWCENMHAKIKIIHNKFFKILFNNSFQIIAYMWQSNKFKVKIAEWTHAYLDIPL